MKNNLKSNWEIYLAAAFMFALLFWVGYRTHEQDKNFALLDHCAAFTNKSGVGAQSVCSNDQTEVGTVTCVKGTVQITCTMNGLDYGFDL